MPRRSQAEAEAETKGPWPQAKGRLDSTPPGFRPPASRPGRGRKVPPRGPPEGARFCTSALQSSGRIKVCGHLSRPPLDTPTPREGPCSRLGRDEVNAGRAKGARDLTGILTGQVPSHGPPRPPPLHRFSNTSIHDARPLASERGDGRTRHPGGEGKATHGLCSLRSPRGSHACRAILYVLGRRPIGALPAAGRSRPPGFPRGPLWRPRAPGTTAERICRPRLVLPVALFKVSQTDLLL